MHALVTGAAGFIGSHLVEALLDRGDTVIGVDCFTDYYATDTKRRNLAVAERSAGFELVDADLLDLDLTDVLDGVDLVFHHAAQPGVRLSWADGFSTYVRHNVEATQRLLEAARSVEVQRCVYASSSSIYGNADRYPCVETDLPRPFSPYGVTKLAAEQLCVAYAENYGLSTTSLRYFTVYGPRQRPDMAFHRLIQASLSETPFPLYGDGSQERDFTYVADVVAANLAAADADTRPGSVFNVAGGGSAKLREVIELVEQLTGRPVPIDRRGDQAGDVARTGGDIGRAEAHLGWTPVVETSVGLAAQVAWHRSEH